MTTCRPSPRSTKRTLGTQKLSLSLSRSRSMSLSLSLSLAMHVVYDNNTCSG
ncbi:GH14785 [Drosophila grimshawi]|uniref:GH14785 n=1 Tax=Drosophila grimshawi TaxID=7222 RepID=B4J3M7_DROGR|nr:GH14785 [Drosophila grimshawi]